MTQYKDKVKKLGASAVNAGLLEYPLLMASDILLYQTEAVPVGKDQSQHLEMTIDIAESVNNNYNKELFKIPEAIIHESTGIIIGLDGRKMSKTYNNTIPLFLPAKKLRKLIMKIVTNSQTIEEPKNPDTCNIFSLYRHFATEEEIESLRKTYLAGGMGWGYAKQLLFEAIDKHIAPYRDKYYELMERKSYIDEVLENGSEIVRKLVDKKLDFLRKEIGLR